MQEKDGRGRSLVSQDPPAWDACFVLPPGPAATLAVGGLHFAGGHRLSLSRAFTFNCCSGLGGAAGFGPQAQCSVLAHLCSHQQGLTFHQVASGDVAARGSGAPRLRPAALTRKSQLVLVHPDGLALLLHDLVFEDAQQLLHAAPHLSLHGGVEAGQRLQFLLFEPAHTQELLLCLWPW